MEIILTDPAAVAAARPAVVVASDTAAASAWLAFPLPSGTARSENPTMTWPVTPRAHPTPPRSSVSYYQAHHERTVGQYSTTRGQAMPQIRTAVGTAIKIVRAVMTQVSQRVVTVCRSVAAWCLSIATRRRSTASLADHWPRGMLSAMWRSPCRSQPAPPVHWFSGRWRAVPPSRAPAGGTEQQSHKCPPGHGASPRRPHPSAKRARAARNRPGAFRDRSDHGSWGRRSARPVRALHSGVINEPLTTALPPPPTFCERRHHRLPHLWVDFFYGLGR
jgi:hypothetical protein